LIQRRTPQPDVEDRAIVGLAPQRLGVVAREVRRGWLTGPSAERTLPCVDDELSPTVWLLNTSAALPWFAVPYGPADES